MRTPPQYPGAPPGVVFREHDTGAGYGVGAPRHWGQPESPQGERAPGPVLHTPPPPGYAAASTAPGGDGAERRSDTARDPTSASVRNQVVDRMVLFNSNHAQLAWTNRRSQPICPHGVAFLYADPVTLAEPKPGAESPYWHRVVAATRVVHDTSDVRELPALLYRLTRLARSRYLPTPGGFDPAAHMAVYHDKSSGAAQYIGIGVSTLDAIDTSWEQAYRRAEDVDDIGGRAFALLYDHTAILADRGAPRTARGDVGVHCTGELNYASIVVPRIWTRHHDVSSMPVGREVWDLMYELHQLVDHQNPRPML